MNRRRLVSAIAVLLIVSFAAHAASPDRPSTRPIPIILDTDIGSDIDDTWAIAMVLNSPEVDVKLIVTSSDDTVYRAKLAAKYLTACGRTDIPVGVGKRFDGHTADHQAAYVEGYDLESYPGVVHDDGVEAMIEVIDRAHAAGQPVTVVTIGQLQNIEEALKRAPEMAAKTAGLVSMLGSVRVGYGGSAGPAREYNAADVSATQATFDADWPKVTITPLDSCGTVRLDGREYEAVASTDTPMIRHLMKNYRIWLADRGRDDWPVQASSILYDTVAIYLIWADDLLKMERLPIRIDDRGIMRIDPNRGRMVHAATGWKDYSAFEDLLVERLTKGR